MSDSATDPYTKIPNALLDSMAELGNAELRVLLAIIRKTAGWGKACDVISLTQIGNMTGLARRHIIKALASIEDQGWIAKEPAKRNGFCYRLVPLGNQSPKVTSTPREPEPVPLGNQSLVPLGNTQKKEERKERKRERAQPKLDFAHEGVATYKRLSGNRKVAPANASLIASKITDLAHWEAVVSAWLSAGYRSDNIGGMLDWYEHPEKMRRPGPNGHKPADSRPPLPVLPPDTRPDQKTTTRALAEMIRQQRGQK